jgi:hypothetical protein
MTEICRKFRINASQIGRAGVTKKKAAEQMLRGFS